MSEHKMQYPSIKVFLTKKYKFRARITESDYLPTYEVTVGGKEWRRGKADKYESIILKKCEKICEYLDNQIKNF